MSKVWFITGASKGFGREFVLAALERTSAREPHPIEQLRAASH